MSLLVSQVWIMVEWWGEGKIKLKGGNTENHFMQLLI